MSDDIKGIIIFSLREYLKDKKPFMPCDTSSIPDKSDIFLLFLNSHDIVLQYGSSGIDLYWLDDQSPIDRNLYLSFKTRLCIATTDRLKEFELPPRINISYPIYWLTIKRVIKNTRDTMKVKIHLKSEDKVRIVYPWL